MGGGKESRKGEGGRGPGRKKMRHFKLGKLECNSNEKVPLLISGDLRSDDR